MTLLPSGPMLPPLSLQVDTCDTNILLDAARKKINLTLDYMYYRYVR